MSSSVVFRPEAVDEMMEAFAFYEGRLTGLGDQFQEAVDHTIALILQSPLAFTQKQAGFRQAVVHRFPFTVWFDLDDAGIYVLAIWHTSRNPDELGRRL